MLTDHLAMALFPNKVTSEILGSGPQQGSGGDSMSPVTFLFQSKGLLEPLEQEENVPSLQDREVRAISQLLLQEDHPCLPTPGARTL